MLPCEWDTTEKYLSSKITINPREDFYPMKFIFKLKEMICQQVLKYMDPTFSSVVVETNWQN